MKRYEIPWAYIVALILYVFWALGNTHVTIWHWIGALVFYATSRLVYAWSKTLD